MKTSPPKLSPAKNGFAVLLLDLLFVIFAIALLARELLGKKSFVASIIDAFK